MTTGTLKSGHALCPKGLTIPGEEEAFIRQAEHLGIPRAGKGHGRATRRGGASRKPEGGGAKQARTASDLKAILSHTLNRPGFAGGCFA
jgi:hypothetical protein